MAVTSGDASMHDDDELGLSDEEGGRRYLDIYIPPPVKPYCSSESKGPRLIITNIVIENFKSYAGKVELGPFNHCTSAVIGPNGSGKSNVIDAMLFVFGYRAQKLRLKKLSLLLHNSSNVINADHCSVYVYFKQILDNNDGTYSDIPGSDFMISRSVYRDNSSHYAVDNKKLHFKEVAKILKQHGVDLDHNRFLILQGEVESIAMMKPKAMGPNESGLLEYLEDIVGTSRYKEPLIKINERVETLNEERTEKHNRCKLSEREMKDLEQPWKEAIDYLTLENDMTSIKNTQFQKYIYDLNKTLREFQATHEQFKENLDQHDKEFQEIREKLKEKESLVKEESKKCDELNREKENFTSRHRNAINKVAELAASLQSTNTRRKQLMTQVEKEKTKLEELKEVPEKNKKTIEEIEKKIESLGVKHVEQQEVLNENLKTLQDETKDLSAKKEVLQTELIDLQKIVDESKAELTVAESELKMAKLQKTTETRKLISLQNAYKDSEETLVESKATLETVTEEFTELKSRFELAQRKHHELLDEEKKLSHKLQALNAEVSETQNSMQSSKSKNSVLQNLMEQKEQGRIPGILGRLGDLGGIDAKYDVAISTACGPLDNIVVDTVNTAQSCIEFLKRNDIGRGTFIALEKVKHNENKYKQRIQIPENANRLFDLIRVEDERVLSAFYYSLQDTLVANDLDQATRIAYGARRYRVVTLKGEMIEISGKMSGGGRSMMRGRMGQSVTTKTVQSGTPNRASHKTLERLQIQVQEIREKVSYNQEQQSYVDREIASLKRDLPAKEKHIKTLTLEIKGYESQLPRLKEQIDKQQEKADHCETNPEKERELTEQINEKKELHTISEVNAKKVSSQVDKITKKITDITDSKIKAVKDRIKALKTEVDKLTAHRNMLSVEISTSERNVKKTENKIEDLKEEIEIAQTKMTKDNELRGEKDKEAVECTEAIERLKKEIEEVQSTSTEVHKEIAELRKMENDGKLKRMEIEQKIKEVEKNLQYHKNQIPLWEKRLSQLKYHEIPSSKEPHETLKIYTDEELEKQEIQELQNKITVMEEKLNAKKPNLSVIQEYETKRMNYLERVAVLEEITTKRNNMRSLYDEVRKNRYTEFMHGFHIISKKLKEMYQTITMGGDAELELADSMDPFNEGIIFSVRPPKKSWKQISNLSGGEKTLSSLALVFALHYYKPSPLYVMDEIDAALDFKNVSIVANYIKQRARNAQFIIISLRANMFELCDILVGIYKINDCSASIAIKNETPEFARQRLLTRNNNQDITTNNTSDISPGNNSLSSAALMDMDTDAENIEPPSEIFSQSST